jgi:hypothetical protein
MGWRPCPFLFIEKEITIMYKKTHTYKDYNGVERTEDFYFNLTKAEVAEMEMSTAGGFAEQIKRIVDAQDAPTIIKVFKDLVLKAYGQKSPDGRRFIKSEELANEFAQTEAYSDIFMELATDDKAAAEFINGIMPVMEKKAAKK